MHPLLLVDQERKMDKILVLGVEGSGKTTFARKLAKENGYRLIDDLPRKFIKRTDLAIGFVSDYRADLMFMFDSLEKEYKYHSENYIITTSPIMTYTFFVYKTILSSKDNYDTERMLHYLPAGALAAKVAVDSFWYDQAFRLPYKGKDERLGFLDECLNKALRELGLIEKVEVIE